MNVGVAKSLRKYCKLELAFGLEIIGLLLCTESSVELGMVKPEPYTSGRFTYTWTNALAPKIFTPRNVSKTQQKVRRQRNVSTIVCLIYRTGSIFFLLMKELSGVEKGRLGCSVSAMPLEYSTFGSIKHGFAKVNRKPRDLS
jgi:hypothetical protein